MYAVIKTGGKQYKVTTGDVVKVEKLAAEEGKEVVFNEVLALDSTVGTPLVDGASVKAMVLEKSLWHIRNQAEALLTDATPSDVAWV